MLILKSALSTEITIVWEALLWLVHSVLDCVLVLLEGSTSSGLLSK